MKINVGDEVLVAKGSHWMEHGRVYDVDRKTYQHPFVIFNLRNFQGRLLIAQRMVPEHYCASFGPGVTKKCLMCETKTSPGSLVFRNGGRLYCSKECAKRARNERRAK